MIADWRLALVLCFQSCHMPLLASIAAGADFLALAYSLPAILIPLVRCSVLGLGVSFFAPWVFVSLRLADSGFQSDRTSESYA